MGEEFIKVMQEKSDAELLEIITKLKGDFQPKAVFAAEEEIKNRNLSVNQLDRAKEEVKEKEKDQAEKENEDLGLGQRILFFLFFWGVVSWSMAGTFKANGYKKKYKDAVTSMKIGFVVFVIIPAIVIIVLLLLR